jgi:hypothetical protein
LQEIKDQLVRLEWQNKELRLQLLDSQNETEVCQVELNETKVLFFLFSLLKQSKTYFFSETDAS